MPFPLFTTFPGNPLVPCHPQFLLLYQDFLLSVTLSRKGALVGQRQEFIAARLLQSLDFICCIQLGKTPPSVSSCSKIGSSYVPVKIVLAILGFSCFHIHHIPHCLLPSAFFLHKR